MNLPCLRPDTSLQVYILGHESKADPEQTTPKSKKKMYPYFQMENHYDTFTITMIRLGSLLKKKIPEHSHEAVL